MTCLIQDRTVSNDLDEFLKTLEKNILKKPKMFKCWKKQKRKMYLVSQRKARNKIVIYYICVFLTENLIAFTKTTPPSS